MLNVALKRLLDSDAKILGIKFWGIIYGLKNDYYIVEADADPPDDEEEETPDDADKVFATGSTVVYLCNALFFLKTLLSH